MTDEEIIDTYSEIVLFLARARTGQPSERTSVTNSPDRRNNALLFPLFTGSPPLT